MGEGECTHWQYADDIVLLTKDEEEMRSMMKRLEEYMERKRLEVNTEKNDHEVQERGGGRMAKKVWRWKGRELEEVKEFKYLRYVIQRNGEQEAQVRDRAKRTMAVMG